MKSVKKYPWIDVLYTLGIILVILGHSHPSEWTVFSGTFFEKLIIFIYIFHMPLFFFIAGFLFMNSNAIKRNGYGKWIKEKCIKLLTPYVILSMFALIPKYYLEHHTFITAQAVFEAICIPRIGVWGHFWFIPVVLLCYVIFGIWRTQVTKTNIGSMLSIVTLLSFIVYFIPFSTQWFGFSDLKSVSIYFCIGMWVKYLEQFNIDRIFRNLWGGITIVIAFGIACVFHYYVKDAISSLIVSVLMIYVSYQLAKLIGNLKVATWISRNNFTIYIYSWPFQAVMMVICGKLGVAWYFTSVLMFLIGFAGPLSFIRVYDKLKVIHNRFFALILGIK